MKNTKLKRYTKVKVEGFEGVIQNICCEGDAHRMTISVPGIKGKFWIVIPNGLIEVIEND